MDSDLLLTRTVAEIRCILRTSLWHQFDCASEEAWMNACSEFVLSVSETLKVEARNYDLQASQSVEGGKGTALGYKGDTWYHTTP